ncbi:MAG: hypothetical protein KDC28_16820 [Saprospiraceae bacterium]|nr:hypothetical protein [Saprospiraceae bacterium]MCB9322032.1 hypothetical protein [Lewinellaceae bacterium]
MHIWDRLFKHKEAAGEPPLRLGRYTDLYKEEGQYNSWDRALDAYDSESYWDAIQHFMDYLRDPGLDNAKSWIEDHTLQFSFFQGSKQIFGRASSTHVRAESRIAFSQDMNIGFLRRLIEQNFALKYSRFTLDDKNYITLVFDTALVDASPYKLYYALKELAVHADKQDDLLISEFRDLDPVNTGHTVALTMDELEHKYKYFQHQIHSTLTFLDSARINYMQYPASIGYLLLALCYKLDYLLVPQGTLMEAFEKMHRLYFAKDNETLYQKVTQLRHEIEVLQHISREEFDQQLYLTKSTFGITTPVNHQQIQELIQSEFSNINWYMENDFPEISLAICDYLVGYCFFNYALPEPDRDLFRLYYRIREESYFRDLGFPPRYLQNGKLDKKNVRKSLEAIEEEYRNRFPHLRLTVHDLNYEDQAMCARSFLAMVGAQDLTKLY